jgi:hypothetical protein
LAPSFMFYLRWTISVLDLPHLADSAATARLRPAARWRRTIGPV